MDLQVLSQTPPTADCDDSLTVLRCLQALGPLVHENLPTVLESAVSPLCEKSQGLYQVLRCSSAPAGVCLCTCRCSSLQDSAGVPTAIPIIWLTPELSKTFEYHSKMTCITFLLPFRTFVSSTSNFVSIFE